MLLFTNPSYRCPPVLQINHLHGLFSCRRTDLKRWELQVSGSEDLLKLLFVAALPQIEQPHRRARATTVRPTVTVNPACPEPAATRGRARICSLSAYTGIAQDKVLRGEHLGCHATCAAGWFLRVGCGTGSWKNRRVGFRVSGCFRADDLERRICRTRISWFGVMSCCAVGGVEDGFRFAQSEPRTDAEICRDRFSAQTSQLCCPSSIFGKVGKFPSYTYTAYVAKFMPTSRTASDTDGLYTRETPHRLTSFRSSASVPFGVVNRSVSMTSPLAMTVGRCGSSHSQELVAWSRAGRSRERLLWQVGSR